MPSPAPSGTASHVTRARGHLAHFPIFSLHMCVLAALCNFTCHLTSHHNRTQDRGLPVTTHTFALQLCASHLSRRQLYPHPTLTGEQEHTATAQRCPALAAECRSAHRPSPPCSAISFFTVQPSGQSRCEHPCAGFSVDMSFISRKNTK